MGRNRWWTLLLFAPFALTTSSQKVLAAEMPAAAALLMVPSDECEECETQTDIPCSAVNQQSNLWGDDIKAYCSSHGSGSFTAHNFSTGASCESGESCFNCDGECHSYWEMSTCTQGHNTCGLFAAAIVPRLRDALDIGDLAFVAMAVRGIDGFDIALDGSGVSVHDACREILVPIDRTSMALIMERLNWREGPLTRVASQ
jgi:hypothetical protein